MIMIFRNSISCTIAVSFSTHFTFFASYLIIQPQVKKIYVNIFGEMNCVKNTRNNGTARNNIALLQKQCCVVELSVLFYLTFS